VNSKEKGVLPKEEKEGLRFHLFRVDTHNTHGHISKFVATFAKKPLSKILQPKTPVDLIKNRPGFQ